MSTTQLEQTQLLHVWDYAHDHLGSDQLYFHGNQHPAMTIHLGEAIGSFTTYWDDVEVSGPLTNTIWENFAPTSLWVNFNLKVN